MSDLFQNGMLIVYQIKLMIGADSAEFHAFNLKEFHLNFESFKCNITFLIINYFYIVFKLNGEHRGWFLTAA